MIKDNIIESIRQFFIDEIAEKDENLHLDIRNIENNPSDYKAWTKLANNFLDKGNYYKILYENSKSEHAKSKSKSMYEKSIICSDQSIEIYYTNKDSWYDKGIAHDNIGKFNSEDAKAIRPTEKDDEAKKVKKKFEDESIRNYKEAIECYDKVIENDPNYYPVWNNKGNVFNYQGKFQEAIRSYGRVLENDPDNFIALYNKGLALRNLGKYEEAEECYDKVIENDPKNIEALNAKGYVLERRGKYEEAEECYRIVTEIYSNEIDDMNKKATYYQKLNKYDEAIICYDKIIKIDANNFNAWLNKGILFYKLNEYEKAIECYDRALGLNKYEEEFKENGKIIDYYHKTIDNDPKNIEALNAKGLALEKLRNYDDAIHLFDLVIAQNPYYVIDTIIKKGDIFMTLGNLKAGENYKAAEKSYNDALQRDPHNLFALNKLHTLYSNYTFQYDKAISVSQLLLKNLSVSQPRNSDKLIKYIYTKSQRKNNRQTKQKNLSNEESLDAKILLSEDFIKNGNYKQGRQIAKETSKEIPDESIKRQIIIRFLIIASYLLQGKKDEGTSKIDKFLTYYRNLDIDIKIEENQWNFKGLLNAISKNKDIDGSTKTILRNLIDLLCGFTDSYKVLLKTTVESIDQIDKTKIRKKIKNTAIISLVVVAALSIFYVQMIVPEACSVDESRQINLGNVGSAPIGIDFNPLDNKAYIASEKDRTISILDCNVPRYHNIFKQYFNTQLEVERRTISLDNPPYDIAVNPTTNKIYVIHQLPSPSLSVIDGNNNYQILQENIPVGRYPLDIAINPITNKVYVTNSIDGNVSVVDGETDKWITDIDVSGNPFNVGVNPTTNKVYVTHQGSNFVSIIDETKEKNNIKNISLLYQSPADLNINSKTNKVYVAHPINNTISIIDGTSDKLIKELDVGDKPIRIDIDESGKVFVVNQGSDSISVIDGTTDTIIKTLKIPSDKPYDVEFNSDINSAYVINMGSNSKSTVDVIKYDDDNYLNYIDVGDKPVDIDVNPKTKKTYVVNYDSDTLSIINSTDKVEETIDVGDKPRSIAVNPITNKIYVTHQLHSPSLSVIDGNNNYQILQENIPVGKDPLDIAVNTNSNKVYVANYGDGTVSVVDGETDQLINKSMDVGDKPIRIAVNTNSNKVYVANYGDGTVSVVDGETDQLINKSMVVDENPNSIEVNPNTNKVYVGYSNNFHLSVIDGKSDRLLVDNNNEKVMIGPLSYPCPSDIAINQVKNHAYVSFDCKDHIFLIDESNAVIPAKTSTLGTKNTDIVFNPATNKIYVLDTESNIIYIKDVSEFYS
jgi:YVTN family beta-propeller protein